MSIVIIFANMTKTCFIKLITFNNINKKKLEFTTFDSSFANDFFVEVIEKQPNFERTDKNQNTWHIYFLTICN